MIDYMYFQILTTLLKKQEIVFECKFMQFHHLHVVSLSLYRVTDE